VCIVLRNCAINKKQESETKPNNQINLLSSTTKLHSYSMTEYHSLTQLVGKNLRPQKKKRCDERLQQMETNTLGPTPGRNKQWELLYPNLGSQLNMVVNDTNQVLVQHNKDLENNIEISNMEGSEEIPQNGKQAATPAFKTPRCNESHQLELSRCGLEP
jgi:hypothetical protein